MVSVPLPPWTIDSVGADGEMEKGPAGVETVSVIAAVAVWLPEVPVTVTVEVPSVAVEEVFSVSTLVPVAGLALNVAVTPPGKPVAASVTLPVNPPKSVTLMVSAPLLPWTIVSVDADGASVKPTDGLTVRAMLVVAFSVPEVPVTVTVETPTVAVELAVSVSTLVALAGLVAKAAVTPLGRPDAARVTLPVNPSTSVTVMVPVADLPWEMAKVEGEAASVKPGAGLAMTVSEIVVFATIEPEAPMIVRKDVPAAAVLVAVSFSKLVCEVVGLGVNVAVTPAGRPAAESVVLPLKQYSITVMVSVAVPP